MILSLSRGSRRMAPPEQHAVIQLVSMYVGSQRLRGACLRAATTAAASVLSSVMRQPSIGLPAQAPRASGYQCTSSTSSRRWPVGRFRRRHLLRDRNRGSRGRSASAASWKRDHALPAVVHGPEDLRRWDSRPWPHRRSRRCAARSRHRWRSVPACDRDGLASPRKRACVYCQRSGSLSRLDQDRAGRATRTRPDTSCSRKLMYSSW